MFVLKLAKAGTGPIPSCGDRPSDVMRDPRQWLQVVILHKMVRWPNDGPAPSVIPEEWRQ